MRDGPCRPPPRSAASKPPSQSARASPRCHGDFGLALTLPAYNPIKTENRTTHLFERRSWYDVRVEALTSRLCRDCGLCCDGSLFARVPIAPDDAIPAQLTVLLGAGGGRYVPQPCSALVGLECSCYSERPQACRRYRCLLVDACAEGEVSLREALKAVHRARDYVSMDDAALREDFLTFTFGRR